jgi:hypothetical protein
MPWGRKAETAVPIALRVAAAAAAVAVTSACERDVDINYSRTRSTVLEPRALTLGAQSRLLWSLGVYLCMPKHSLTDKW